MNNNNNKITHLNWEAWRDDSPVLSEDVSSVPSTFVHLGTCEASGLCTYLHHVYILYSRIQTYTHASTILEKNFFFFFILKKSVMIASIFNLGTWVARKMITWSSKPAWAIKTRPYLKNCLLLVSNGTIFNPSTEAEAGRYLSSRLVCLHRKPCLQNQKEKEKKKLISVLLWLKDQPLVHGKIVSQSCWLYWGVILTNDY